AIGVVRAAKQVDEYAVGRVLVDRLRAGGERPLGIDLQEVDAHEAGQRLRLAGQKEAVARSGRLLRGDIDAEPLLRLQRGNELFGIAAVAAVGIALDEALEGGCVSRALQGFPGNTRRILAIGLGGFLEAGELLF